MKKQWPIFLLVVVAAVVGTWERFRPKKEILPQLRSTAAVRTDEHPLTSATPGVSSAMSAAVRTAESGVERELRERVFGDFPLDRLELVFPILKDYWELEAKLRKEYREGGKVDWERALHQALNLLADERLADLRRVLTADEAEKIDLRLAPGALGLMDALRNVSVTAEESEALLRWHKEFARNFGRNGSFTASEGGTRERARVAMYSQMRGRLGDERFAVVLSRRDRSFGRLAEVAGRYGQPVSLALELWGTETDYAIRRVELETRDFSDPRARSEAFANLKREMRVRVTGLVGTVVIEENKALFGWLE